MRLAVAIFMLLAGCASRGEWPPPFAFVGIPQRVDGRIYRTIDGPEQRLVIAIVRVTKGNYEQREIGFGFGEKEAPPLQIGQPYLFEAFYTRHGIHYSKWTLMPQTPNHFPQPTPPRGRG